jgi:mannose-6-phosphate isomerase-like protein (cupin superfamily)
MPYADYETFPAGKVDKPFERELKLIMSPDMDPDVQGFTLIVATLAPNGGCTDLHTHETSGELMIFTSGTGKAWLDGVEHELKPGVAMYAPPGVPHRTMNTGEEPLTISCVFVPAIDTDYVRKNIEAAHETKEDP